MKITVHLSLGDINSLQQGKEVFVWSNNGRGSVNTFSVELSEQDYNISVSMDNHPPLLKIKKRKL